MTCFLYCSLSVVRPLLHFSFKLHLSSTSMIFLFNIVYVILHAPILGTCSCCGSVVAHVSDYLLTLNLIITRQPGHRFIKTSLCHDVLYDLLDCLTYSILPSNANVTDTLSNFVKH